MRAEMALLVDVGSAWAKAGVIGRVRGRWRLVAHAAQPTAWGAAALRRALVDQLVASADPRLLDRLDDLIAGANRIECHTARRPARLADRRRLARAVRAARRGGPPRRPVGTWSRP